MLINVEMLFPCFFYLVNLRSFLQPYANANKVKFSYSFFNNHANKKQKRNSWQFLISIP